MSVLTPSLAAKALQFCLVLAVIAMANLSWAEEKEIELRVDLCQKSAAPSSDALALNTRAARDSYDRGLVLYEEGDYQGAVDAFVKSYCARAHHAAFYNIAQSYERLLDFQRSIRYFERYVSEADPADPDKKKAQLRAEVLSNLPAQVRVATVPPGARVIIRNASGITARGTANGDANSALEVRQGQYTMHIDLPGYEKLEKPLSTKPGLPYAFYFSLVAIKAQLEVTASPRHARIFLDNRFVGIGHYQDMLNLGDYTLTIEAPGRKSYTEKFQLNENRPTTIGVQLDPPPTSGRKMLLVAAPVAVGLMGGTAMTQVFGQETGLSFAGSIGTTALAFAGAYYGIPENTTRGDAWYLIEAAVLGATEGGLIGAFFACDDEDSSNCNESAITGATLSGGLAGMTIAALTYKKLQFTTGDAALLGSGAIWGISTGALFHTVFDSDGRTRGPLLFIGLNLGLTTAAGLLANNRVSLRRVAIIDLAGVGGVLGGVSLGLAIDSNSERVQHLSILGLVAGLTAGTFLTRYMDDDVAGKASITPAMSSIQDIQGEGILNFGISIGY